MTILLPKKLLNRDAFNSPAPEHFLPLSHPQPAETDNTMPQRGEEETLHKHPHFVLDRADGAGRQIVSSYRIVSYNLRTV